MARRVSDLDEAVEGLALALAIDGHPRTRPFATFGAAAPSYIKDFALGDKPGAIHALADRVQRAKTISAKTRAVADTAAQAARSLAAALLPIDQLTGRQDSTRLARRTMGEPTESAVDRHSSARRKGAQHARRPGRPAGTVRNELSQINTALQPVAAALRAQEEELARLRGQRAAFEKVRRLLKV